MHLGVDSRRHPPVSCTLQPFEIRDNRSGERAQLLKNWSQVLFVPLQKSMHFLIPVQPQQSVPLWYPPLACKPLLTGWISGAYAQDEREMMRGMMTHHHQCCHIMATHHPPTASQATAHGVVDGWNNAQRAGDEGEGEGGWWWGTLPPPPLWASACRVDGWEWRDEGEARQGGQERWQWEQGGKSMPPTPQSTPNHRCGRGKCSLEVWHPQLSCHS